MNKYFLLVFLFVCFSSCSGQISTRLQEFLIFSLYYNGIDVGNLTNCTTEPSSILPNYSCIIHTVFFKQKPSSEDDYSKLLALNRATVLEQILLDLDVNETSKDLVSPDFSQCGVNPACIIQHLDNTTSGFTCDRPILTFIAAIGIFLSAMIIICNVLIITVTLTNKSLRNPHSYFKISLAFADLLAGVFVIPSIVYNSLNTIDFSKQTYNLTEAFDITNVVEDNSAVANFFGIMGVLSTITAVYSLLSLAVDSYLAVSSPLRYRIGDLVTKKKALFVVIIIWFVALLFTLLPLFTKSVFTYGLAPFTFQYIPLITEAENVTNQDSPLKRYPQAFAYVIIVWGIPFLVTWILTVMTSLKSRKMLKSMREARKRSVRSEKNLDKVNRDLVRTVFVLLTTFTITVLPVFGVGIAVVFTTSEVCYSRATVLAFFLATYMFICGRFINVIIYNVFNKEFRKACQLFFCRIIAFLCCVDQFEVTLLKGSSNGKKTSGLLYSTSNGRLVDDKSPKKETEKSARPSTRSISVTTDVGPLSPSSPKSIDVESRDGAMYTNSVYTISEAEEP